MTDPAQSDADRLKRLDEKIAAARAVKEQGPDTGAVKYSQASLAWRMVIELVSGLGIGFGIGYGLDVLFGTTPWLMILFVFAGFAAGVQTVIRSAREVQKQQAAEAAAEEDEKIG